LSATHDTTQQATHHLVSLWSQSLQRLSLRRSASRSNKEKFEAEA